MKKPHIAVRIITGFFATIFCILFVLVSFTAVLTGTVSSIAQPKTIVKFVEQIDLVEVLSDAMGAPDSSDESGIPAELINEFKETEFAKTVISSYAEGIAAAIKGDEISDSLSEAELLQLIDNNLDDLVGMVKEYAPEEAMQELSEEELKSFVKEGIGEFAKQLPTVKEVVTMVKVEEVIPAEVKVLFGPTLTITLAVIALVLAGIIYALRFWRFGGFMWIGVSSFVTALFVCALSLGSSIILPALKETMGSMGALFDSAALVITGQLNIALIILIAIAIIFIAGYIVLYKLVVKKKIAAATAQAKIEEPVVELPVEAAAEEVAVETEEVKEETAE